MISSRAFFTLSAGLLLASAGVASAQSLVQDRYGPPPAAAAHQSQPAAPGVGGYGGQMLGWAGKRSPAAASAGSPSPARPEPMALARQFAPASAAFAPPPTAPRPTPDVQPGYEPVLRASIPAAADAAPDLLGGPPTGSLPTSIYGGPAVPAPQPAPTPRTYAQASATPRAGGSQLYSLHREYGMTPDAIPTPPAGDNFILVGPPETPDTSDDGEEPAEGLDRQF